LRHAQQIGVKRSKRAGGIARGLDTKADKRTPDERD
jgi:hypothetical protein